MASKVLGVSRLRREIQRSKISQPTGPSENELTSSLPIPPGGRLTLLYRPYGPSGKAVRFHHSRGSLSPKSKKFLSDTFCNFDSEITSAQTKTLPWKNYEADMTRRFETSKILPRGETVQTIYRPDPALMTEEWNRLETDSDQWRHELLR